MINTVIMQGGNSTIMLIAMMLGFVFLMVIPQIRKQKKEKAFAASLVKGKQVVTSSGIHARIAEVLEDGVILETLAGKLKFEKSCISKDFTTARFPEEQK